MSGSPGEADSVDTPTLQSKKFEAFLVVELLLAVLGVTILVVAKSVGPALMIVEVSMTVMGLGYVVGQAALDRYAMGVVDVVRTVEGKTLVEEVASRTTVATTSTATTGVTTTDPAVVPGR